MYIGRKERWRRRYGNDGDGLGNPWELMQGASMAARAEVCKRCDALNNDPMHDPMPLTDQSRTRRQEGWSSHEARALRERALAQLSERMAAGQSLLLLCHCRRRGQALCGETRCHGDSITTVL